MSPAAQPARVAAVVGASTEVGGAVVEALLQHGWAVAGFDEARSLATRTAVAESPATPPAVAAPCATLSAIVDPCDRAAVARAVDLAVGELGEIECLIAISGGPHPTPVAEVSLASWQETLRRQLLSVANFSWALLPGMVERGAGNIVTVGSDIALGAPGAGVHHAAAGGAVLGFTRALAIELARTGVQVNAISTELPGPEEPAAGSLERAVQPREIAATAAYLAEECHFFLGAVLAPNGGRVI